MIKKKINLFIHPSYNKTGTTFLQEKIFNTKGFVTLCRPFDNSNEQKKKIVKLHYKVFIAKYTVQRWYPMNYSFLLKTYASELRDLIINCEEENFILSDECIFDHDNYFGYFNFYLLKELIELLSTNLNINIKFIVTIRKQYEYLISSYAYDNWKRKKAFGSFENFLNKILSDKNISEIYEYDLQIKKIKKIFDCKFLVLPLEELEHFPKEYFTKIENFLNIKIHLKDTYKINENSLKKDGEKYHYILTPDIRRIFQTPIVNLNFFLKRFPIYERNLKHFQFLKKIIQPKKLKKNLIKINYNQKKEIQQHFMKSNQNLEKEANINLKRFNYY